jgi:hypothetical protein
MKARPGEGVQGETIELPAPLFWFRSSSKKKTELDCGNKKARRKPGVDTAFVPLFEKRETSGQVNNIRKALPLNI